jgi:hypothetical protein
MLARPGWQGRLLKDLDRVPGPDSAAGPGSDRDQVDAE